MVGNNDGSSEERLSETESIISDCESTAIEIENKLSQLEDELQAAEEKNNKLIAELEQSSADIISQSNEDQAEIQASISNLSNSVSQLMATAENFVKKADLNSENLIENMTELESDMSPFQQHLDENIPHLQGIFKDLENLLDQSAQEIKDKSNERSKIIESEIKDKFASLLDQDQAILTALGVEQKKLMRDDVDDVMEDHIDKIKLYISSDLKTPLDNDLGLDTELHETLSSQLKTMREDKDNEMINHLGGIGESVSGIMSGMMNTVDSSSEGAYQVVETMEQTNIGLESFASGLDGFMEKIGGLSID